MTALTILRSRAAVLGAAAGLVTVLAACGGSSAATATAPGSVQPAANTQAGGAAPSGSAGGQDFQKIQECLQAAGITMPARPSGSGARPSRSAGATRPSGSPGAGGGRFADPQVQAALKACGITVPSGNPGGPGGGQAAPTAGAS